MKVLANNSFSKYIILKETTHGKDGTMTALLEKVYERASHLPERVQDQLASQWIEELEAELKWDDTLENSQDLLESMADAALRESREGKTVKIGFDEL